MLNNSIVGPLAAASEGATSLPYRADIDGLRAVAVLLVVVYHAFPNLIPGGFIGVDIFFVLSGFLISGIIFKRLENNTFSFIDFFGRRIRRIFPSLILVLAFCYVLGWYVMVADEYQQLNKHIFGGAVFVANLILWKEFGYFDVSAQLKPLLHLWSLGIEEQFYLVWPLVMWLAWKRKLKLSMVAIIIILVSFSLNIFLVGKGVVAFYSPLTRFWELVAGALLAYTTLDKKLHVLNPNEAGRGWLANIHNTHLTSERMTLLRNALALLGLGLVVIGAATITKESRFPGWWVLLPVVGSTLIIFAGDQAWLNKKVLSNRTLVWFGLISFPLYLWHWPLLSFAHIIESAPPSTEVKIVAVTLSIIAAWVTYEIIEKPLRFGRRKMLKAIVLLVLMGLIACVGFYGYTRSGLPFRNTAQLNQLNRFELSYREKCDQITGVNYVDDWCHLSEGGNNPSVLVVGDSQSNAFTTVLSSLRQSHEFGFIQTGRGGCPSVLNYGKPACREIASAAFAYAIGKPAIQHVVLISNWPIYMRDNLHEGVKANREDFEKALVQTISAFEKAGKRISIVLAIPVDAEPRACIKRTIQITTKDICNLSKAKALAADGNYREFFVKLNQQFPKVNFFDPWKYVCDANKCKVIEGDKILYVDSSHLSINGGAYLANSAELELIKFFKVDERPTQ